MQDKCMRGDLSALQLVLSADPALIDIVRLSLLVSLSAVLCAAVIGLPLGAVIALTRYPGREATIVVLNALMGLPPVVVGRAERQGIVTRSGELLKLTEEGRTRSQSVMGEPRSVSDGVGGTTDHALSHEGGY